MACCTIQGYVTDKNYYYISVVFIQIVPHWGTNRGYGINQGNTVLATCHIQGMLVHGGCFI